MHYIEIDLLYPWHICMQRGMHVCRVYIFFCLLFHSSICSFLYTCFHLFFHSISGQLHQCFCVKVFRTLCYQGLFSVVELALAGGIHNPLGILISLYIMHLSMLTPTVGMVLCLKLCPCFSVVCQILKGRMSLLYPNHAISLGENIDSP